MNTPRPTDLAHLVYETLTGKAPAERVQKVLAGTVNPAELREKILRLPELGKDFPELRMANEIKLLRAARKRGKVKLIVGAEGTIAEGWVPTNRGLLDLMDAATWRFWLDPGSVVAILAEHVWEHFTLEQGLIAARTCFEFLAPGGRLRLAVPDGLFPSQAYLDAVSPGKCPGHHVLYDHRNLGDLLATAGFTVHKLEYFDEKGVFHEKPWTSGHGHIRRSRHNDHRNKDGVVRYTSVIIDGIKPAA